MRVASASPAGALQQPHPILKGYHRVIAGGGRVDWGADGYLYYDKLGGDGWYNVYRARPDGSGEVELNPPGVPTKHRGNPAVSPDSNWVLFQAQQQASPETTKAKPGLGVDNDIWVMRADGSAAWFLHAVTPTHAIIHPKFSPTSGSLVCWSERPGPNDDSDWFVHKADFSVVGGVPQISGDGNYSPNYFLGVFYETHGFTALETDIVYTRSQAGQGNKFDIARMVWGSTAETLLVASSADWDEHANISPSGNKIVWMSSKEIGWDGTTAKLKTELWIADYPSMADQRRLTDLNVAFFPKRVVVGDMGWAPDGKSLAVRFLYGDGSEDLYVFEFWAAQ